MSGNLCIMLGRSPALLLAMLSFACDASTSRSCLVGSDGCACKTDKSCAGTLVCRSNVCVAEPAALDGGASTGGSNNAGAGGKSNLGGASTAGGYTASPQGGTSTGGNGTVASNGGSGLGGSTALDQGGTPSTGGLAATTGGTPGASGGSPPATGGAPSATGGVPSATGGAPIGTGGAAFATGGTGSGLYPNQITNGDFSQGTTYWNVKNSAGALITAGTIVSGAYCISPGTSATQYVGWPAAATDAAYLQPGGTYVLSYRIKADSATVGVKVGGASSPYTTVYQVTSATAPTSWQSFSYSFPAGTASFGVGVAFVVTISTGTFCVDDVSLALVSN